MHCVGDEDLLGVLPLPDIHCGMLACESAAHMLHGISYHATSTTCHMSCLQMISKRPEIQQLSEWPQDLDEEDRKDFAKLRAKMTEHHLQRLVIQCVCLKCTHVCVCVRTPVLCAGMCVLRRCVVACKLCFAAAEDETRAHTAACSQHLLC